MNSAAQNQHHILITNGKNYLATELTRIFVAANNPVYTIGSPLDKNLLTNDHLTILEIDLAQPLPSYLPNFDLIFHFLETSDLQDNLTARRFSPQSSQIALFAARQQAKLFFIAPIETNENIYEYLTTTYDPKGQFIRLLLVGHLYGPAMPKLALGNPLADLIFQAFSEGRIVLANEGLDAIYPAYITDIVFAIHKIAIGNHPKKLHMLISQHPLAALTTAYEIQKAARLALAKELSLFFAGSAPPVKPEEKPTIKIHDLDFSPKIELAEGLQKTFEYFRAHPPDAKAQPKITNIHQPVITKQGLNESGPPAHQDRKLKLLQIKPRINLSSRPKTILISLIALLILTFAKTGLDLYLGISSLQKSQEAILASDLTEAYQKATRAQKSFNAASRKTKILLPSFIPGLGELANQIQLSLEAAQDTSESLIALIEGGEVLLKDLKIITSQDSNSEGLDLETPTAHFQKAYLKASQANKLFTLVGLPLAQDQIANAASKSADLAQLSAKAADFTSVLSDLTGRSQKISYLILLQNNTELRPGGGFIGSWGLLDFDGGKLKNITVEDIYAIDGQLQEKIEPPKELFQTLGLDRLYLRDSNWSSDFQVNSATSRDLFKKETGRDVAGVIALDLTFIQNLLLATGPIKVNDFNEEITADNLFERGEYYSEIGFFPGSTQKKDFFGALTRALIAKIVDNFQNFDANHSFSWLDLFKVTSENLSQKHLLLSFDNQTLAAYITTHGYSNPLPPTNFDPADDTYQTRDFVALSEANLGANKVNRYLNRQIFYEMTIGRDADLVAQLKIVYQNESQAETWPKGKYVNFLRVYLPVGASLAKFQNGQKTDLKEVQVENQNNLTVFSTFVEVPIKSTTEVIFNYRLPKNIKLEKAPIYSLYFQKQPGTEDDHFEFTFNLPNYLKIKSINQDQSFQGQQSVTEAGDLTTDRQFEIEIAKNSN